MKNIKKKGELHPSNPHRGKYNFKLLIKNFPELETYMKKNPKGEETIDFSDNRAVLLLNKSLLKTYYNINNWNIPKGFLCPPIPGRADYIHYISDLIDLKQKQVKVLDIGTGANCIYPIIGSQSYNWNFVASDINLESIKNAEKIIKSNFNLRNKIILKFQKNKNNFFKGVVDLNEKFDLTMCNPPFFTSLKEARNSNRRKVNNLRKNNKNIKQGLNFGGQQSELWCLGGEKLFLKKMIKESIEYSSQINWFTSLVSNKENLNYLKKLLKKLKAKDIKIIEMSQGQKISRILAWSFKEKK